MQSGRNLGAEGKDTVSFCLLQPFYSCPILGRTPTGAYSPKGRSRHLLETLLLRTPSENPSQNPFYCKTHIRPPSQNPSPEPFPRTFPRTFSEPFLERCVAVRPLRRAPNQCVVQLHKTSKTADLLSRHSVNLALPRLGNF